MSLELNYTNNNIYDDIEIEYDNSEDNNKITISSLTSKFENKYIQCLFITISNNLLELNSENHDGTMNKGKVAINNISNNVYQLFNTSHDISNIESDYNKLSLNKDVLISNIIEKVELGTNNEEILREEMGDTSVKTGNINNYVGKLLFTDKLNTKIYLYTKI